MKNICKLNLTFQSKKEALQAVVNHVMFEMDRVQNPEASDFSFQKLHSVCLV